MKKLLKHKGGKTWLIASCVVATLATAISVAALGPAFNLAAGFLGRKKPVYEEGIASMYPSLVSSDKTEAFKNANKKNVEICEEGFVLLKNENGALPLPKGSKLSVFGKNSVNLSYGGSGSSAFKGVQYKTINESLKSAGYQVNETLEEFYKNNNKSGKGRSANSNDLDSGDNQAIKTGETPQSKYTSDVTSSYDSYNDAALIVITRIGGEGFDLPRYQGSTEGAVSKDSHYLELDTNEIDLIKAVSNAGFKRVIVLFNIPSSFEAPFLETGELADKIDAALWIGFTGGEGIMALGSVLNGSVNPSGRTVDTWASDFTANPTWNNFGTGPSAEALDKYDAGLYYFVDYEENIFVGYRYYETRGLTDEAWYKNNVTYPFGYGKSYTTFEWSAVTSSSTNIEADKKITVSVKVTNTGKVAGKDVVELYCAAPYEAGGIPKAAKVLVGFAKTKELKPNESDTVQIEFDPYTAASYDYKDKNENGFAGYELERGTYALQVSKNSHEVVESLNVSLSSDITYDEDPVTKNTVENRYTDRDGITDSDYQLSTTLSRDAWDSTWPDVPSAEERKMSKAFQIEFSDDEPNNPTDFGEYDLPDSEVKNGLTIRDFLPDNTPSTTYEPIVSYDDERWDKLLDQGSIKELEQFVNHGDYQTLDVSSLGLPATQHGDGPSGFTYFLNPNAVKGTCHYCSEPVMASTFNAPLIKELGNTLGEEGVWGNSDSGQPYSSIYAPGVNIHRSPFGGRNAEYFSEDPLLSGKLAAAEVQGAQELGVICQVKHFAVNDQETHRARFGDCSWLTEQALREIYLKPFEIAVKEGKTRGIMSSFNRIGLKWTGGDYRLITEILRDEWGFKGMVICDFNTHPEYMFTRQMAYAGGDLNLANTPVNWVDDSDVGDIIVLRQCAKNIAYALANSNAMNGKVVGYKAPMWANILIAADSAIALAIVGFGVLLFLKSRKD